MTLTTIEKAAKLLGYEPHSWADKVALFKDGDVIQTEFNPYTKKSDLMHVECALGIDVIWCHVDNQANGLIHAKRDELSHEEWYSDHSHDKFTARAHAVVAVAVQIYDKQFGGE